MCEAKRNPTDDGTSDVRRWLAGVAEIATAVNAPVPLPVLLDLVAEKACTLMGYELCAVLLANDSRDALVIEGSYGLTPEYVARVNTDHPIRLGPGPLGEGPSSRAFNSGEPQAIDDITVEPMFRPWGEVAREQGYRSMVSVPLRVAGTPAGALNCYRTQLHTFDADELDLLITLADQAGIAIETARLRDRERDTIADLEELNESLTTQHRLLQEADQIHRDLTSVALRAAGVQGVAAALSGLLARPVLITDPAGHPLGSAEKDGSRLEVPHVEQTDETGSERLTELPDPEGGPRIVAPVLLGGELVARIWLPGRLVDLGPLGHRAVEHGATVAALELLRRRTALEVEWRLRGDLLSDLLSGVASGTLGSRARTLGHDLSRPHAVLVIKADTTTAGTAGADLATGTRPADVRRLLGIVHSATDGVRPRPLVTNWGEFVVVLWPDDTSKNQQADPVTAGHMIRRAVGRTLNDSTVSVAVGAVCSELSDYAAAFRVARGALELAQLRGGRDRTVTLSELGVYGLLLQLDDPRELIRYADRVLAPLRAYDSRRDAALIETLRTYLEQDLNTARTAAALYVHPNTVGLRLKRIEELLGSPLSQPETLLQVQAALMTEDVLGHAWPEHAQRLG
ncbi:GAF domain-containing protein [Streptomyces sp. SID8376]|nr:GAF domain-containing protein [Streptomyces sp. McG8]MYW52029.1 GAF domain-containing protein [Streptomyces sp. SID8376]THC51152.1 GAF domain-containing protein [Streptomyces sp. Akac8]UVT09143.1 GAF domain-containing protein [Streptomyces thermocarboxydus]